MGRGLTPLARARPNPSLHATQAGGLLPAVVPCGPSPVTDPDCRPCSLLSCTGSSLQPLFPARVCHPQRARPMKRPTSSYEHLADSYTAVVDAKAKRLAGHLDCGMSSAAIGWNCLCTTPCSRAVICLTPTTCTCTCSLECVTGPSPTPGRETSSYGAKEQARSTGPGDRWRLHVEVRSGDLKLNTDQPTSGPRAATACNCGVTQASPCSSMPFTVRRSGWYACDRCTRPRTLQTVQGLIGSGSVSRPESCTRPRTLQTVQGCTKRRCGRRGYEWRRSNPGHRSPDGPSNAEHADLGSSIGPT